MGYADPAARRARVLGRHFRGVLSPSRYPRVPIVPAYWWDNDRNFGDHLTRFILGKAGMLAVHRPVENAAMIGVGSIIEHLPANYSGVVWGSGLMFDRVVRFPNARFLAVRGRLTAERLGIGGVALGDPGLLVGGALRRLSTSSMTVGVVPHFRHQAHPDVLRLVRAIPGASIIDVRDRPGKVISRIARCQFVVASSLHGLITADSLGIPALWTTLTPQLEGGTFKFLDHESVVTPSGGRHVHLSELHGLRDVQLAARRADADLVANSVRELKGSLDRLRTWAKRYDRSPLLAFQLHNDNGVFASGPNSWPTQP
jgi:hypothetical protein